MRGSKVLLTVVACGLWTVVVYAVASYPSSIKSFTTRVDGQTIVAAWFNEIQDEVVAIETALLDGFAHAVKPSTDNAQDLGTAALSWRDLHVERNALIGGTLGITGVTTFTGAAVVGSLRGTEETITATGSVNDQVIGATTTILRCNNATALTITGFTGGAAGRVLIVESVGAGTVEFDHQTGSTAANQLINFVTVGNTPLAAGTGRAVFVYDGTTSRWRLVAHEQGAWITPTFAAGDYTASSGNWTVDSGDVTTFKYKLVGSVLHVNFNVVSTDVSATPTGLIRALPASYTSTNGGGSTYVLIDAAGTRVAGAVTWTAAGTSLTFEKIAAGGTWGTTSSDNTSVFGSVTVEVT